ncbi:NAD(P)-dependent alcohol dehydrogenase [Silvibacterium sp.]|uniref:NAD(P)-dependent alcohol dehydrogenase n=1 Tax=Silvibacterium sp. TaxID=1964179 RepID=UPI0039E4CDC5
MSFIQGYAVHAAGAELLPFKYDPGQLNPYDVEVRISHCGVCHSDAHLIDNDWGISQYPLIPGHEIVGMVSAVGSAVVGLELGTRVGIGWQANSCGRCEWCRKGEENLCASAQPTCVHRHGGFAEAIRVNSRFAIPLPEALESDTAAPLLCAGITVYSPLRSLGINPASRVGIIGLGGLGHLALQFARVFGAEVTAISTSAAKEQEARELGAHHFVNSRESKAIKELAGSFDLIISTITADLDWASFVQTLRPHGSLCFVGAPDKPISVPGFPLISVQRSVCGSNTGSPGRIAEMLDVAARHNVRARIESFRMSDANQALGKLRKGQLRYRAVLGN